MMADASLSVVQVRMSTTHPQEDICDLHSKRNKFGLGPGCYPKAVAPKPGFHPHCRCKLVARFDLDAKKAKERPLAEQAFLLAAGDKVGGRIMGSQARWFGAKTGKSTVEEIFNRYTDPLYHLGRVGDVGGTIDGMNSEELALLAGDLKAPTLTTAQREARDYVVANGKRTGNEYGVAISDGKIIDRFTSDSPNGLQVPRGYGVENGPVEIHHNHPVGDSFSLKDIAILLARNELGAVAVHGHVGFYAYIERVAGSVSEETAMAVVSSAKSKAKLLLTKALSANIVSFEQINSGLWQVVMAIILEAEGVIRYTANSNSVVTLARKVVRRG